MRTLRWYWLDLRCWWLGAKERAVMAIVWRLPEEIIYWAYIRVQASATTGPFSNECPDDVNWSEALRRWEKREGGDRAFQTEGAA
jgi:hypothetical protein